MRGIFDHWYLLSLGTNDRRTPIGVDIGSINSGRSETPGLFVYATFPFEPKDNEPVVVPVCLSPD